MILWSLARAFAELLLCSQTAATTPTLAVNKPTVVIGFDARHQSQKEIAKYMAYACPASWSSSAVVGIDNHADDGIYGTAIFR